MNFSCGYLLLFRSINEYPVLKKKEHFTEHVRFFGVIVKYSVVSNKPCKEAFIIHVAQGLKLLVGSTVCLGAVQTLLKSQ